MGGSSNSSIPCSPEAETIIGLQEDSIRITVKSLERSLSQDVLTMSASNMTDKEASASAVSQIFANRHNSAVKWQRARDVIGALEVKSEPYLDVYDDMCPHLVKGKEEVFHNAVVAWEDLKLLQDFHKTVKSFPNEYCCCGLMSDEVATKRRYVEMLNDDWCKRASKKLNNAGHAFKLDTFLWNWQNASGKAESNIIMIRFYELSTNRFRRASSDSSMDLDILEEGKDARAIEVEASSMVR